MNLPKLPRKTNRMYSTLGGRVHYSRSRIEDDRHRRGHHGRLNVYYGPDLDREIVGSLHAEYHTWNPVYLLGGGIEVAAGGEDPVKLSAYLWPVSLYLRLDTPMLKRIARRLTKPTWDGEREVSLHMFSRSGDRSAVSWNLWTPSMSWEAKTPKWRNGRVVLANLLLGRRDMRWETVETAEVMIPMFEREYPATVEIRDHVSWFRRLPFLTKRVRCADVEIPGGIGVPGKGENAWDVGDDAIYAMSCRASTVEDAIGQVVASVLRDRKRHGGSYRFAPAEAAR